MYIKKTRPLALESIRWVNMNEDIENTVKHYYIFLGFQQMQLKEKTTYREIPGKPWKVIRAGMFLLYKKHYLCRFIILLVYISYWNFFSFTEHAFDCQRQAFKLSELFIRSEDNQTTMPLYGLLC